MTTTSLNQVVRSESNVNGYAQSFPATFAYSRNDILRDNQGKEYIDFFSGAGALNYGHNNELMKDELLRFLDASAPVHCLDMDTVTKLRFLEAFDEVILQPRGMQYKFQFPSPSGTNAVEAAIKLARKVTGRPTVVSFTNSFHGMTAGSLAVSASQELKHSYIPAQNIVYMPFDGFMGEGINTMDYLQQMFVVPGSGNLMPAAIILETIQAEGGVRIAGVEWLRQLEAFTKEHGIILIVDDIQVGCGRTGQFFSFERAGISPDIILLSKSLSGFGLPLSLVLLKPELDIWSSGEHNGTFRANNLSLCTAIKALDYWRTDALMQEVAAKADTIAQVLQECLRESDHVIAVRGMGMIWGVELSSGTLADEVSTTLFEMGMIIETCGNRGQVVKLLPALTISAENLATGLERLKEVIINL